MSREEREYLINVLVMFTNKTESYFFHMDDEELENEYARVSEG